MEHAQRFLEPFSAVCNQFRPRRHRMSAQHYRKTMRDRFRTWQEVVGATSRPSAPADGGPYVDAPSGSDLVVNLSTPAREPASLLVRARAVRATSSAASAATTTTPS